MPTNYVIDPAIWVESWSGYALNRQGPTVAPWGVPMVVSNVFRIDPEHGAIRFWYRPDYSSTALGGKGPGDLACLLTMVSGEGKESAQWWTLAVGADGNEVHVICETDQGPAIFLSAPVAWESGGWHLVTLGYTTTNSALFLDDELAALGKGFSCRACSNRAAHGAGDRQQSVRQRSCQWSN